MEKKIFLSAIKSLMLHVAWRPSMRRQPVPVRVGRPLPTCMEDAPHVSSFGRIRGRILFGTIGEASNLIPYLTADAPSHEIADLLYVAPCATTKSAA